MIRKISYCVVTVFVTVNIFGCAHFTVFKPKSKEPSMVKEWKLAWEEQFDSFNPDKWERATHTFDRNLAQFEPGNVVFEEGRMKLFLKKEIRRFRNYLGAEYRTKESYLYGKFVVRMRPAKASGIISSFFTFRDSMLPWSEVDIEFLGKDTAKIHLNYWNYRGNEHPKVFPLNFDAGSSFHEYSFEWQPNYIRWCVDGIPIATIIKDIPKEPQKIMMNIWISSYAQWAGTLDESMLPVCAEYDYVRYYTAGQ